MKKVIIIVAAVLFGLCATAQAPEGLNGDNLKKLKQRTDMQRRTQMRTPMRLDKGALANLPVLNPYNTATAKATTAKQWVPQMPGNRWFPGEWEEVKAIVVTFPYTSYPADHMANENYSAQMYVPGYGVLYKYNETSGWQYYGVGAVDGIPDTTDYMRQLQDAIDYYSQYLIYPQYRELVQEYIEEYTEYFNQQESFRGVFANLIHGIQQSTQVWINVWHISDSTIIKDYMSSIGKPLTNYRFIESYGNAFWYRDCGPICFYYGDNDDLAILDFEYKDRACDDLLPDSIARQMNIPIYHSTLKWEGGNCLVDGAGVLVTSDATVENNADANGQIYATGNSNDPFEHRYYAPLTAQQVHDSLQEALGTRATYIIPRLKYDGGTGHVDLYADMWDENEFVFSKYPDAYSSWSDNTISTTNINTLTSYQSIFGKNYKKSYIPFPSKDNGSNFTSQSDYNRNYTRSYSNHTFVNQMIIQPCFSEVVNGEPSSEWDRANIEELRSAYPGYTIYPIDVRSFDGYGGAIHCITKQIPADNPIRILHSSVTRHDGTQEGKMMDMSATVTNRSGIASVTVYWRANGGEWHTTPLTAGSNNVFAGTVDFVQSGLADGEQGTIEYYISATSNNGKTITKPMTASQGGYYTFDLVYADHNVGIGQLTEARFGQFYPNPARSQAWIDIAGEGEYMVSVIDAMGRTMRDGRTAAGRYDININGMATGIYSVRFIADNGQTVIRRLIVK